MSPQGFVCAHVVQGRRPGHLCTQQPKYNIIYNIYKYIYIYIYNIYTWCILIIYTLGTAVRTTCARKQQCHLLAAAPLYIPGIYIPSSNNAEKQLKKKTPGFLYYMWKALSPTFCTFVCQLWPNYTKKKTSIAPPSYCTRSCNTTTRNRNELENSPGVCIVHGRRFCLLYDACLPACMPASQNYWKQKYRSHHNYYIDGRTKKN